MKPRKPGSYARGLPKTEFLPYSPYAKISPASVAVWPTPIAAALLIAPSIIPTYQGICDILLAITKHQTRFQRSKQRLGREEPSEKREDESRRANFSP